MSRRLLMLVLLVAAAVSPRVGVAQTGDPASAPTDRSPPADAPLSFRRIFAPADRLSEWPWGEGRFLPVDRAEFERLVSAATARAASPASPDARLSGAEYRARLDGAVLVEGVALLEVRHAGPAPAVLPLEPLGLAIGAARWAGDPPQAADLSTSDGVLRVRVERPGSLEFPWTLAGRRDAVGAVHFDLVLPRSPASRLVIDLPETLEPATDAGLRQEPEALGDGLRRWRIELGGNWRCRLQVAPIEGEPSPSRAAAVRQSLAYDLSPRGLDLTAQWRLQAHGRPVGPFALRLDPSLQLVEASLGAEPVTWTLAEPGEQGDPEVLLHLPHPMPEPVPPLVVKALAPLRLDEAWRLPRLLPQGVFWEEGDVRLTVSAPLALRRLETVDCRQSDAGLLPAPRRGEWSQFQCFSPGASLDVLLSRTETPVNVRSGTTVELGAGEIVARVAADFRMADSEQFSLEAQVAPGWLVDSVEAEPTGILEDWLIEGSGERRRLSVRLAKPLTPERPVRIVVSARRLQAVGEAVAVGQLIPLRPAATGTSRHLLALRTTDPYRLRIVGAEPRRPLGFQDISADELALFREPKGLLLDTDVETAALQVVQETPGASFSGEIRLEATVGEEGITEEYAIRCIPQAGHMEDLLVRLVPTRATPLVFRLSDEQGQDAGQDLDARRLTREEQAAAGLEGGAGNEEAEIWRLRFRRPLGNAFEIRAVRRTRRTPDETPQPICLATLPEASRWSGWVVVRRATAGRVRAVSRGLEPSAIEPLAPDKTQTLCAAFRYDPDGVPGSAEGPALAVSVSPASPTPALWVWDAHLRSWYEGTGRALHAATFHAENVARDSLRVGLPSGVTVADVQAVLVDGAPAAWVPAETGSREAGVAMEIPLPAQRRFVTVCLRFRSVPGRLGTFGALEPVLPTVDAPVLAGRWTVWMPPGYEVARREPGGTGAADAEWSLVRRLFGRLGREGAAEVFDPLRPETWWASQGQRGTAVGAAAESYPATGRSADPLGSAAGPRDPAARPNPPWSDTGLYGPESADVTGWTIFETGLSEEGANVQYVYRDGVRLVGAAMLLAVVALGGWRDRGQAWLLLLVAALSAAAALLLPAAYQPIPSGALLGALSCLLLMFLRTPRLGNSALSSTISVRPAAATAGAGGLSAAGRAGAMLAMVGWWLGAGVVVAQNAPEAPHGGAARRAEHRVFVPIDDDRQPLGDKIYVPEELWRELHRRALAGFEKAPTWQLRGVAYRGALAREAGSGRPRLDVLRAVFDLHVFGRFAAVRIPLSRAEVNLLPDGALLNDRPVQIDWDPDGAALLLEVPEPGEYRLEVAVRPSWVGEDASAGFDLAVPRVASARLELALPTALPVEVPTALGRVVREDDPPRVTAELGPADRLSVRWSGAANGAAAGPAVEAETLLWLRFQPGSVVLDARLKFRALDGPLRQVQILADPKLRMLPLEGADAPAVETRSPAGQPQSIVLSWAEPKSGEVQLDARFLVAGISGLGNLRLPEIELAHVRTARRWLGLSADATLECELTDGEGIEPASVTEFAAAWGSGSEQPLAAYRLDGAGSGGTIASRARPPRTVADQKLILTIDRSGADLTYAADLNTAAGYRFQYRLAAPQGLLVANVSLVEDGVARNARWAQDDGGSVTVFLDGPVTGRHQLAMTGRLSLAGRKRLPLPTLRLEGVETATSLVEIRRSPSALVVVAPGPEIATVDPPQPPAAPAANGSAAQPARLVGVWRLDHAKPLKTLIDIEPNEPVFRARQVTWLRRSGNQWRADVSVSLEVTRGVLDQLQWLAPVEFAGPYRTAPSGVATTTTAESGGHRLTMRPTSEISERFECGIGSVLSPVAGRSSGVPNVALLGAAEYRRYVALPGEAGDRPLVWRTRGLSPAAPLDDVAPPPGGSAGPFTLYEVTDEVFDATLRPLDAARSAARVTLADVRMAWQSDGSCRGVASFDVEPGRSPECPLWIPEGFRLVQTWVGGVPAVVQSVGRNVWRVTLVPGRLPQRIDVLFEGSVPVAAAGGRMELPAPSLGDRPAGATLWTVAGPAQWTVVASPQARPADSWRQEFVRLKFVAATLQSGATLSDSGAEETANWYHPWAVRLVTARQAVERELAVERFSQAPRALVAVRNEVRAIDQEQTDLARRLGTLPVLLGLSSQPLDATTPETLWQATLATAPATVHYVFPSDVKRLAVRVRPASGASTATRLATAAGLALVPLAGGWALRRRNVRWWLRKWPQTVGVAAGLAWWLWLWPGAFGWVLVAASIVSAVRSGWRVAAAPPSSVISLSAFRS